MTKNQAATNANNTPDKAIQVNQLTEAVAALSNDIKSLNKNVSNDIERLNMKMSEMSKEMEGMKQEMSKEMEGMKQEMSEISNDMEDMKQEASYRRVANNYLNSSQVYLNNSNMNNSVDNLVTWEGTGRRYVQSALRQ